MKRSAKLTVGLAAGGVLITAGVLGAGSVFASETTDEPAAAASASPAHSGKNGKHGKGSEDCEGHEGESGHKDKGAGEHKGEGMGGRQGEGQGEHKGGPGGGHGGMNPEEEITAKSGTLTDAQKATLAAMAEEEKLALDLYTAFADRYDTQVFDRISESEAHHLDTVRVLLDRYKLDDPTTNRKAGSFADAKTQETYDRLLEQGKAGEDAAFKAGRTVEVTDIEDLNNALKGLNAPDAKQVYERLVEASQKHLNAFERQLAA
jgi:hypothetical protein